MTQSEINDAVSQALGEDINEVNRRGFDLFDPFDPNFDPEPNDLPPQVIDWDQLDLERDRELTRLTSFCRAA